VAHGGRSHVCSSLPGNLHLGLHTGMVCSSRIRLRNCLISIEGALLVLSDPLLDELMIGPGMFVCVSMLPLCSHAPGTFHLS
jgi:hypothetical protein